MKVLLMICLVFGTSIAVMANCAERFRANLAITIEEHGGQYRVINSEDVVLGKPLTYNVNFGSDIYNLDLVFIVDPAKPNEYTLTVSLVDAKVDPKAKDALHVPIVNGSFKSLFVNGTNGPLEFQAEGHDVKVKGAVAMSKLP